MHLHWLDLFLMLFFEIFTFATYAHNAFFMNLWWLYILFDLHERSRKGHSKHTVCWQLFCLMVKVDRFDESSCLWFEAFWHSDWIYVCRVNRIFFWFLLGCWFSHFALVWYLSIKLWLHVIVIIVIKFSIVWKIDHKKVHFSLSIML